jgi:hypothetical protein
MTRVAADATGDTPMTATAIPSAASAFMALLLGFL